MRDDANSLVHGGMVCKQKLEKPKGLSDIANRRRIYHIDNIMIKRKRTKLKEWLTNHYTESKEEFEDTKGAIRIHISQKNIQRNDQKKKYKRTNIYI